MQGIRLTKKFEKACAYWPGSDKNSRILQIQPDETQADGAGSKRFKFEMLERGAASHIHGASIPVCSSCPTSEYCRSLRIPHADFALSPSQQKKLDRFREIAGVETRPATYDHEYFALFKNYVQQRHAGSSTDMLKFASEDFKSMVTGARWILATRTKDEGALATFALIDQHGPDFCLEYLVYDTRLNRFSPGLSTILLAADILKKIEPHGHLYLGSWSPGSPKTGYKKDFLGAEIFTSAGWEKMDRGTVPEDVPRPAIVHFLR